jgi:hypothetical protein
MHEMDLRRATRLTNCEIRLMEDRLMARMRALGLSTRGRSQRRARVWWNVRNRLRNMWVYRGMKGLERAG